MADGRMKSNYCMVEEVFPLKGKLLLLLTIFLIVEVISCISGDCSLIMLIFVFEK